jgi:oxygen-dependent protoporphyrinogen oxidase
VRVVVVGGGIAGVAAARRLSQLLPEADLALIERERRLGGMLLTERTDGFVIEGAADSLLSRKERGVALCEELGIELVGRRPEHRGSFVRHGDHLHPLPEGLTGMIPTSLDALESTELLSPEGKARFAAEVDLPPVLGGEDESVAAFVSRRFGREAYDALIEPLLTGIYGGDGERLSLQATFPQLRALELDSGSVIRGLQAQSRTLQDVPPFLAPVEGMGVIVQRIVASLTSRVAFLLGKTASFLRPRARGYSVEFTDGTLDADGVVLAVPGLCAGMLLDGIDADWLAEDHYDMEYASSVVVTLAFSRAEVVPLDGYGYVVPRAEGSDVLACTWSSQKWEGRAPDGFVLIRVYAGRFGGRDVTTDGDDELVSLARDEIAFLGVTAAPVLTRVHRWPRGMPQYVLGHPERVERIDARLAEHPGLAVAGAAYRGVGIPDCIASGEAAAESVARALVGARA